MKEYRYLYEEGKLPGSLESIPLLDSIEERHLRDILATSRIRKYAAGEVLIREGDTDKWVYVLLCGRVRVTKGGEPLSRLDGIGNVFGEMAMITREPRTASVAADRDTVCLAVNAEAIDRMPPRDRNACYLGIMRLFVKVLSERLKSTSDDLARREAELAELKQRQGSDPQAARCTSRDSSIGQE